MSPALEKLKQKGYEVIYVSEPIDEMTLQNIEKFSDKVITGELICSVFSLKSLSEEGASYCIHILRAYNL